MVHFPNIDNKSLAHIVMEKYNLTSQEAEHVAELSSGSLKEASFIIKGGMKDIKTSVVELIEAVLSNNTSRCLAWAEKQPRDRNSMELIIIELQRIFRDSMRISVLKGNCYLRDNVIERRISDKIKGFSNYRDVLMMLEELLHEIRLNPQFELFWSNLPFAIAEKAGFY